MQRNHCMVGLSSPYSLILDFISTLDDSKKTKYENRIEG